MIPEFFEDKEIFITGGSGIVGTALIEQILRSCNVRKIHLLLRAKKNMTPKQRLAKVKEGLIFRQLKLLKPYELDEKLEALYGDAILPMLGITQESAKQLENVSIIYHCAATVRFDEPLKDALKLNVGGTLEALKFAQTLRKLKLFMHVSTFFSNPYLTKVEPKFYKAPMDWKLCLNAIERNDIGEDELNFISRKLIVGFPNTYTFTKNLAESLVNDYRDKLPVCIYRPSIVYFAVKDPEPGFTSSLMGLVGLYAVSGSGLLKTIFVDNKTCLDISPQDIVVKNMLYFTQKTGQLYENSQPQDIPVFITSSGTHCDITLRKYLNIMDDFDLWHKTAFEKSLLVPSIFCTSNRFVYMTLVMFLQLLPALLVDGILRLCGRKPALMHIQRRIFQTLEVMQPFMFNNYESPGVTDFEEINEKCKDTNFSVKILAEGKRLHVTLNYCETAALGIRHFLLKQDPKSLPKAKIIYQIKNFLVNFVKFHLLYKLLLKILDYTGNSLKEWRVNELSCADY